MKTILVLYIFLFIICISVLLTLFINTLSTTTSTEIDNFLEFEDPLIVSLITATSYTAALPIHLRLLNYLFTPEGAKIIQLHKEIVSSYRYSPISVTDYYNCTCDSTSRSCYCRVMLIPTPVPANKYLDPNVYQPLIRFSGSYATLNFNISFPDLNKIVISALFTGTTRINSSYTYDSVANVFEAVSIPIKIVQSVCADDQDRVGNNPQVSLCLSLYDVKVTKVDQISVFSFCINVSILVNSRLLAALYPLGCFEFH